MTEHETPAELRAKCDRLTAEALKMPRSTPEERDAVLAKLDEAAFCLAVADRLDEMQRSLRVVATDDTVDAMDTHNVPASARNAAGRSTRKHPAQAALYKHGVTVTALAKELKEGRPRVNAWFAEGEANRPIPRHHAKYLERKYGIPLDSWERIAE